LMLQKLLGPQLNEDPDFENYQEIGIHRYTGTDKIRINIFTEPHKTSRRAGAPDFSDAVKAALAQVDQPSDAALRPSVSGGDHEQAHQAQVRR
jgi:hypothetical protein